jgi:Amidohydrolase
VPTRASNAFDGVAGEVLYPSQGLFYFKVADTPPMSAIFRAYNDWLAEFCRTDPVRLKGIAMINLDDVPDGIKELELAARLGLSGAMITEYPLEHRRYDGSEYEPFWAAAAALDLPLSLHTATRRQGQDPRGRRQDIARRQQPGDEGVLSGAVDVRSDLLRASSSVIPA